jgi:FtsZ-binding cell division protein ZapB
MVYLYLCSACQEEKHGRCELGHPSPPGTYGGSLCKCPCRGNAQWNTPEYIQGQLREKIKELLDFEQLNRRIQFPSTLDTIKSLQREIDVAKEKIEKIQNDCPHLNVNKKYGGSTGNYDPSNDRYWTELHCPDCDKRWTVDGTV